MRSNSVTFTVLFAFTCALSPAQDSSAHRFGIDMEFDGSFADRLGIRYSPLAPYTFVLNGNLSLSQREPLGTGSPTIRTYSDLNVAVGLEYVAHSWDDLSFFIRPEIGYSHSLNSIDAPDTDPSGLDYETKTRTYLIGFGVGMRIMINKHFSFSGHQSVEHSIRKVSEHYPTSSTFDSSAETITTRLGIVLATVTFHF